jgi:hypothetical protein
MKIGRILNNELELLDIIEWGEPTGSGGLQSETEEYLSASDFKKKVKEKLRERFTGLEEPTDTEIKLSVGQEFVNWAEQYWNLKNYKKIPNPPRTDLEYIPYNFVREVFIDHIDHLIKIRLSGVAKGWTELTIGEEFINWSEQNWQLKEQYDKPEEEGSESCPYDYVKNIFIQKIDEIIKNRL